MYHRGFPDWLVIAVIGYFIVSCCHCLRKAKDCTDYDYNEYGIQNVDENGKIESETKIKIRSVCECVFNTQFDFSVGTTDDAVTR